ncbi:hypothetical protein [Actinoplanes sp. DH11]|uniref:hypothetical protein n=1 Tax=Actinoplanes sp. DH11 TaxID=2857011 RepID=UPI001E300D53|nr:hypothetical protein [Actinoplanes sp. DH11]
MQVPLAVTNNDSPDVKLYWRNGAGSRVLYYTLQTGDRVDITTYRGHVWEIANNDRGCMAKFVVDRDADSSGITVGP